MIKENSFTYLGLFFNLIWLLAARFSLFPMVLEVFFIVLGMSLMSIGIYMENHKLITFKTFKKTLFRKLSH